MKPSGIGGQAVIEGVMMKNADVYAVAVRKPNQEIVVEKNTYKSKGELSKLFKLPILRGIIAFIDSMTIGSKTLSFSASFYEEEEATPGKVEKAFSKIFKEKAESIAMGLTFLASVVLAMGIFIVLPGFIASFIRKVSDSYALLAVIEGVIRIAIFITYIFIISQIKDIKRMFMYHGAEHKTINCLEQGFELTVENVKWQSKQHKRCGTSFMFIVMFISIIFFVFIRVDNNWLRYLIRILLVPVIAGVSYEFIRLAGKSNSKIVHILSKPGMWLQGLTTKEPDDEMIEVAIMSVEAVFDWRSFLEGNSGKSTRKNRNKNKNKNNDKSGKKSGKNSTSYTKHAEEEVSLTKEVSNDTPYEEDVTNKSAVKNRAHYSNRVKPTTTNYADSHEGLLQEEEEDEILKALDRYLMDDKESVTK